MLAESNGEVPNSEVQCSQSDGTKSERDEISLSLIRRSVENEVLSSNESGESTKTTKKLCEYKRAWQRAPLAVAKRNERERTRVHTVNQVGVLLLSTVDQWK
ncbi:unnamed protein product [Anisakis simplex]|uniref:Uncharacterized protein n=1 Tax=Anisakis simplex TaxID=6269 RepID=A0A0M3JFE2_ANISI|nr:unnamed protein product [Anisakis simplex]